jgi:hypothetical protein
MTLTAAAGSGGDEARHRGSVAVERCLRKCFESMRKMPKSLKNMTVSGGRNAPPARSLVVVFPQRKKLPQNFRGIF